MVTIDIYDLLLESAGFRCDRLGITKQMIDENQDEINSLKVKLGITSISEQFNLILFNNMTYNLSEIINNLHDVGCGDRSFDIIKEIYYKGSATVKSGSFMELMRLQNKLSESKYKTVVRRVKK